MQQQATSEQQTSVDGTNASANKQPPTNEYLEDPLQQSDSDEDLNGQSHPQNQSDSNNDSEEHDKDEHCNEDDTDEDMETGGLDPASPSKNYFSQNAGKINTRYLNYRSSLTNSVRGSLLECSVPENDEEAYSNNENLSITESASRRVSNNYQNQQQRLKKYLNTHRSNKNSYGGPGRRPFMPPTNSTASNPNNVCVGNNLRHGTDTVANRIGNVHAMYNANNAGSQADGAGYAVPSIYHIRRFMSTIDAASFLNAPLNLESVEFNLRNSLVKKCSDTYRKNHHHNHHGHRSQRHRASKTSTLFLDYLTYLTSYRLLFNGMLLVLAVSFFLSMCGTGAVLFYIREVCMSLGLIPHSGTQVLALMGLMVGFGRFVSTLSYKVNESNPKSRVFAYTLSVLMTGVCVLVSTVLCDSVFSFAMFAISFGLLLGNL